MDDPLQQPVVTPEVQTNKAVVGHVGSPIRAFPYKKWLTRIGIVLLIGLVILVAYKPVYGFFSGLVRQYTEDTSYEDAGDTTKRASSSKNNSADNAPPDEKAQNGGSTQKNVYCNVSGMPKQVCDAAKSVEADGVKNNSYVLVMTDGYPDNLSVKLEYASWEPEGKNVGYMRGVAHVSGRDIPGWLTFRRVEGNWKVTAIDLDS